jgi:hypothetical protein
MTLMPSDSASLMMRTFWQPVTPLSISFRTWLLRFSMPGWITTTPASARACSWWRRKFDFTSQWMRRSWSASMSRGRSEVM